MLVVRCADLWVKQCYYALGRLMVGYVPQPPSGNAAPQLGDPLAPPLLRTKQWEHPNVGVKCKGVGKSCNFQPIPCYSSQTVEDRWVYAAMRLASN